MTADRLAEYIRDNNPKQTQTNELRWVCPYKVVGDLLSQTKLQQKWLVEVRGWGEPYEEEDWRDIPVVFHDR